ncbi:MAG: cytochrome c family protein [Pseudomonadota bacterium]
MRKLALILSTCILAACGGGGETSAPASVTPHAEQSAPAPQMTSLERGAILYKRCRACHTLGQGERNKVGPNLWQIFGQTAGAREDFNYSSAMAESGVVWTDETMSAYLERPAQYMPGNRMSFAGLRKEEDRAAVIEYLRANTGADVASDTTEGG